MGGILLQALLKSGLLSSASTCATVAHEERANALAAKLGVKAGTSNVEAVKDADVIVIGVKPQVVEEVVEEIRSHVTPKQLIVSVVASVPTSMIEKAWPPMFQLSAPCPIPPACLGRA
jgi:pyrroline-5-carboxylate reductase